jgi:hypothetical protein
MFFECKSLENIKYLHNWNILKGYNILNKFYECSSLKKESIQ